MFQLMFTSVSRGMLTKSILCCTVSILPTMMVSVLPLPSSLPTSSTVYTPSCRSVLKAVPVSSEPESDFTGCAETCAGASSEMSGAFSHSIYVQNAPMTTSASTARIVKNARKNSFERFCLFMVSPLRNIQGSPPRRRARLFPLIGLYYSAESLKFNELRP